MDIQKIKELYEKNENLTEYFKKVQKKDTLTSQEIELIYDLQAGNYSNYYENDQKHREYKEKYTDEIIEHINSLDFKFNSILEAGIGEATTFFKIIQKLNNPKLKSFGFDISWSRLAYAQKFIKKYKLKKVKLVTGLLENIPFLDNSVDIVYTSHSIEPNGGKEKEILKELYRVTKNYLILLEPSYELGDKNQKKRMDRLSYAKNLTLHCKELGYKIIKHELLNNHTKSENLTSIIIVEKSRKKSIDKYFFSCPETKTKIYKKNNFYYSPESFYCYPILNKIICLNSMNKILTTKLNYFFGFNKNDPSYSKHKFIYSLKKINWDKTYLKKDPFYNKNERKIKDLYSSNSIGIFALEEFLNDKDFVNYIKELIKRFSKTKFVIFYFDDKIKYLFEEIYSNILDRFVFIIPENITDVLSNISVLISSSTIINEGENFYLINKLNAIIDNNDCNILLRDYCEVLKSRTNILIRNMPPSNIRKIIKSNSNELRVTSYINKVDNDEFFMVGINKLLEKTKINANINLDITRYEYDFFIEVDFALNSKLFIKNFKTYRKELNELLV